MDRIVNQSPANLFLMHRPDLISTFTKIALWKQTKFKKLVYLDADTVALRAPDELFSVPATFAAVPDIGWPDCFNSGVLVLTPNMGDYYALLALAQRGISFDGADQGLLNMHFSSWHRLSFTNNCTPSANYQYVPAYRHFQSTISIVHYIGESKPWKLGREDGHGSGAYNELLARWWAVYDKHYRSSGGSSFTIMQYVKGERIPDFTYTYPLAEDLRSKDITTEASLASPPLPAEQPPAPLPTAQQRKFSIDWDPIHQPPPSGSRPEASEFPTSTYSMSSSLALFQPPSSYPPAPGDTQDQPPKSSPSSPKPPPIFPWETSQAKPTRVFADDSAQTPTPSMVSDVPPSMTTDTVTLTETQSPTTPMSPQRAMEPFATYQRTNAWDEVPEIERYLLAQQQRRNPKLAHPVAVPTGVASIRAAAAAALGSTASDTVMSPITSEDPSMLATEEQTTSRHHHRPSMKLTDFPTEFERPSLPVTPAPAAPRRPSFWGDNNNNNNNGVSGAEGLPKAEGVPEQNEWDPVKKLEELQRRQSLVLMGEGEGGSGSAGGENGSERVTPQREEMLVSRSSSTGGATTTREDEASPGRPSVE